MEAQGDLLGGVAKPKGLGGGALAYMGAVVLNPAAWTLLQRALTLLEGMRLDRLPGEETLQVDAATKALRSVVHDLAVPTAEGGSQESKAKGGRGKDKSSAALSREEAGGEDEEAPVATAKEEKLKGQLAEVLRGHGFTLGMGEPPVWSRDEERVGIFARHVRWSEGEAVAPTLSLGDALARAERLEKKAAEATVPPEDTTLRWLVTKGLTLEVREASTSKAYALGVTKKGAAGPFVLEPDCTLKLEGAPVEGAVTLKPAELRALEAFFEGSSIARAAMAESLVGRQAEAKLVAQDQEAEKQEEGGRCGFIGEQGQCIRLWKADGTTHKGAHAFKKVAARCGVANPRGQKCLLPGGHQPGEHDWETPLVEHTPGPWKWTAKGTPRPVGIAIERDEGDESPTEVAFLRFDEGLNLAHEAAQADAKLISAAPEMKQELEMQERLLKRLLAGETLGAGDVQLALNNIQGVLVLAGVRRG
jgi:hypothetical protein